MAIAWPAKLSFYKQKTTDICRFFSLIEHMHTRRINGK